MRQTMQLRVSSGGHKASKPLAIKSCGGCGGGRTSQPHKKVHWRDPQGPRMYTNHPPGIQHQKSPICLWVAGEVTESWQRAEQAALFPLRPLPQMLRHNSALWVSLLCEYLRLHCLQHNRYAWTKKYSPIDKEQVKTPEKKLSNEEIDNQSHTEFKYW